MRRLGRFAWPAVGLASVLLGVGGLWLPGLPGGAGRVGVDYAFFLPNLVAGYFWHVNNGWFAVPWFTPAQCGGSPLQADPQGIYYSLPQLLTVVLGPLRAVRVTFLAYAGAGFLGAAWLGRAGFRLGLAASLFAGAIFALNGFYAVRMMVGHLGMAPFMLLPAMAGCLVGAGAPGSVGWVLRCAGFALLLACMVQGGMAVLVAPVFLSLLIVLAMQALATGDGLRAPLLRLAAGAALGIALCAGRLAVVASLMAHVPRDLYAPPGYASLAQTAWVALQAVFMTPSPDMAAALHGPVRVYLHELDYGVGPTPLLFMLAAAAFARPARPGPRAILLSAGLALLLAVPLALNTGGPYWSAFLHMLPILRNSSLLLRWFAAYILPACLGGALALDVLADRLAVRGPLLALAGVAATFALLVPLAVGGTNAGGYDPAPLEQTWRRVAATGRVPPITVIAALRLPDHSEDTQSWARQDSFLTGGSQIDCYQPLYGYALEAFVRGALHPGPVLDVQNGQLNLKDPACSVFPGANACRPGDAFASTDLARASAFAAYRPFAWRRPPWAQAADWLGAASLVATTLAFGWAAVRLLCAQRRRATV